MQRRFKNLQLSLHIWYWSVPLFSVQQAHWRRCSQTEGQLLRSVSTLSLLWCELLRTSSLSWSLQRSSRSRQPAPWKPLWICSTAAAFPCLWQGLCASSTNWIGCLTCRDWLEHLLPFQSWHRSPLGRGPSLRASSTIALEASSSADPRFQSCVIAGPRSLYGTLAPVIKSTQLALTVQPSTTVWTVPHRSRTICSLMPKLRMNKKC